jgi:hypothetical protein
MSVRSILRYTVLASTALWILSCAALGTKVTVIAPETLPSIKSVAVWPVASVPLVNKSGGYYYDWVDSMYRYDLFFHAVAEDVNRQAESVIETRLANVGLFRIVGADSVAGLILAKDSTYERFPEAHWEQYPDLVDVDAIIVTKLDFVSQDHGTNTYAVLSLIDRISLKEIARAEFNTQWGKSYLVTPKGWKTMPQAVRGAVNGLIKALKENQSAISSTVSN